jgi:ankyrin repeat protein
MTPPKPQINFTNNFSIPSRDELWKAIQSNTLKQYQLPQLQQGLKQENNGRTLYHRAVQKGLLKNLPQELLTQKELLKPEGNGWNCFQLAAHYGHLNQVPEELLTLENLWDSKKREEINCFHLAASQGNLNQIPPHLLTPEILLQKSHSTGNCLQLAVLSKSLETIPTLPLETLKTLQNHFTEKNSTHQKILAFLQTRIQKIQTNLKTIQKSLKQDHQAIL